MEWAPRFDECFELAPDLPSGLRWKVRRGGCAQIGEIAGTNAAGYWNVQCYCKKFRTSHIVLVLAGIYPEAHTPEVDHIDRNRSNNKLDNLRWCDRSTNLKNRKERALWRDRAKITHDCQG